MQFARYQGAGGTGWEIITDAGLGPTNALGVTVTYDQLANPAFFHRVEAAIEGPAAEAIALAELQVLAPVPRPGKIIYLGLNYHDHAAERDRQPPERPLQFTKSPTAAAGNTATWRSTKRLASSVPAVSAARRMLP